MIKLIIEMLQSKFPIGRRSIGLIMVIFIFSTAQPADGYLLNHTYTNLNGDTVSYDIFEGKLLLVEAFSTTCPACWQEHDELKQLYNEYGEVINMLSITINPGDDIASLTQYQIDYPATWLVGFDPQQRFASEFNIQGTPTMILFNQEGRKLNQKSSFTVYAELSNMVGSYLAISNPQPGDTIAGYDSGESSGSLIEDLFGSTLFRISFLSLLVVMVYIKATGTKTVA